MEHTLVLEVPDYVFQRLASTAESVGKSVQQVAAANLAGEPLSLEPDLEEPYRSELIGMATWSDEALSHAVREIMPGSRQRGYETLRRRKRLRDLTQREHAELECLREEADRLVLRKARAAVLLGGRGHAIPRVEDLPALR